MPYRQAHALGEGTERARVQGACWNRLMPRRQQRQDWDAALPTATRQSTVVSTPYHRTVHRYSPFSRSMPRQWTSAIAYAVTTFKSVNASKIWSMSMLLIARPRFRGSGSTVGCCFGLSVLYFWGQAEERKEERRRRKARNRRRGKLNDKRVCVCVCPAQRTNTVASYL